MFIHGTGMQHLIASFLTSKATTYSALQAEDKGRSIIILTLARNRSFGSNGDCEVLSLLCCTAVADFRCRGSREGSTGSLGSGDDADVPYSPPFQLTALARHR